MIDRAGTDRWSTQPAQMLVSWYFVLHSGVSSGNMPWPDFLFETNQSCGLKGSEFEGQYPPGREMRLMSSGPGKRS